MHYLPIQWDNGLVVLSILIAVMGSYLALECASRIRAASGDSRQIWLFIGAISMGLGIWSMQLVGMLALIFPNEVVLGFKSYELVLSALPAIIGSGVAFFIVCQPALGTIQFIAGSLFMGFAIVSMHYIGMAALRMPGVTLQYEPMLVIMSVLIAISASGLALWMGFQNRQQGRNAWIFQKLLSSVTLGLAISGMHYTGMLAVRFLSLSNQAPPLLTDGLDVSGISLLIIVASAVLGAGLMLMNSQVDSDRYRALLDLRLANEELKESEQRFRLMADSAPVLIWTADAEGQFTYCNQKWLDFTCRLLERELGDGWLEQLHPDDRERWDAVYADALAERQTFSVEFRLRREDGVYRWMLATGNPTHSYLKTPFGQRMFDGFIGTCVDISEHKQSLASIQESQERLQRLNDRLRQSNQELKDFVYVASHDLQEPIRKIITFGERLRHSLSDTLPEAAQDNLGRIESAAYRMHQLINALLDYTRLTTKPQTFQPVNLGNILQEALSDLELAIEDKKASIEVGPLPAIEADPVQLRQLFQNLISNALKFSRPDEPPVISITCERIHGLEDAYRPYLHQPNQYFCALMVEDNGIGFEPQHAQKIFKAFQRLHSSSQYHGTGIGLAICRKIVERHGGAILADSLPMTYTRFVVLLPFQHEPSLDGLYSSTGIVSEAVSVGNGPRSKLSADLSSRLESVNPTAACRQDLRP